MGHGNPPIQKAIDFGVRPSLSVDVETSVPNDMFTQMRTTLSLQKNEVWARRLAGDKNPPRFLTAREVLEFATVEGARANGLTRKVGSLTPGKEADIILLDATALNVAPLNQVPGAVVSLMDRTNVETVIVAGTVRKWKGKLLNVNVAKLRQDLEASRDYIFTTANVAQNLFGPQ